MLLVQTVNSVKIQQLAIFICHLLVGGQFQTVQIIIQDSGIFNNQLFGDIKSICLDGISWMALDISHSEVPQWNDTLKSDHFIQLIFVDSGNNESGVHKISDLAPNYYRLFVFHGEQSTTLKISNKTQIDSNSNTIALFHDAAGKINAHLLHDDLTIFHQAIDIEHINELSMPSDNVFDKVFGEREQMRKFGILHSKFNCFANQSGHTSLYTRSLLKYFFNRLKMDFLEMGNFICKSEKGRYFRTLPGRIYDEILWEVERIDYGTDRNGLFGRNANILFTHQFSTSLQNSTKQSITAISTVSMSKLYVMFIYGINDPRVLDRLDLLKIFEAIWIQILFVICATTMLYFLRSGELMRQVELFKAYIDVMIAITGGGNLRYRDKLEKIFFGFLFFGTFYINAIGVENFLFATFLTETPERIDSFGKLAKHSPFPLYRLDIAKDHPSVEFVRYGLGIPIENETWTKDFIISKDYSHALITKDIFFATIEEFLIHRGNEFDILPDSLGEVPNHYYLSFDDYVPKNLTKRIVVAQRSMVESGLERFYWTIAMHKSRINSRMASENSRTASDEAVVKVLGLDQLLFFFVIYWFQVIIGIVVFMIELIYHRIKMERNVGIKTEFM